MSTVAPRRQFTVSPLGGALGAVVLGIDFGALGDDDWAELAHDLVPHWDRHLVLFFPGANLSPADQLKFARCFGPRVSATTELGGDYRNAPTLADEGFPELLVLDSGSEKFDARVTAVWHTDVTFAENPPIASLFCMEIATASGGDTMWSSQIRAHSALSPTMRDVVADLRAVHGRPPLTGTSTHPVVKDHHATGERALFVNRGWTNSIEGFTTAESNHVLAALVETTERPEMQVRWKWTSGDAVLWDNRYTMHYAVNDYAPQRRRARRATIYDR